MEFRHDDGPPQVLTWRTAGLDPVAADWRAGRGGTPALRLRSRCDTDRTVRVAAPGTTPIDVVLPAAGVAIVPFAASRGADETASDAAPRGDVEVHLSDGRRIRPTGARR